MSDDQSARGPYGPGWDNSSVPMRPRQAGPLKRMHQWSTRHPVLDGMVLGPIVFLGLLVWRGIGVLSISLLTCVLIGVVATAVGAGLGLNNRRRLRKRAASGEPDSPLLVFLGLSDSGQRSPLIGRVILPAVCVMALVVGFVSAILIDKSPRG